MTDHRVRSFQEVSGYESCLGYEVKKEKVMNEECMVRAAAMGLEVA
jgi:hypothetical protein